ncbi:hypothetical protein ACFQ3W_18265 [Paenibacillus puldeungensis]|uniref:Uncharacterized protein n=1 Tax=Paenibacillus puldeungensis TaxID=696536 RepID=A0ABW3S0L9_9BACL
MNHTIKQLEGKLADRCSPEH